MSLVTKEIILERLNKKNALTNLEAMIKKFHESYNKKHESENILDHVEMFKLYNGQLFYDSTFHVLENIDILKRSNDKYIINDLMRLKTYVNLLAILKEKNTNSIPVSLAVLGDLSLSIGIFLQTVERIELALEALNRAGVILNGEDGFRV